MLTISELFPVLQDRIIEFIYDVQDNEYKLLDINTRVWKWINFPIAMGSISHG